MKKPLHQNLVLLFLFLYVFGYSQTTVGTSNADGLPLYRSWRKNPVAEFQRTQSGVCDTWTFRIRFTNANEKDLVDVIPLPDRGNAWTGNDITAAKGIAGRIAGDGTILWTKEFSLPQKKIAFKKIKHFSNNYLYILGEITDQPTGITNPFILVTDLAGNIQWSRQVTINGINGSWNGAGLDEWRENSFSVFVTNDSLVAVSKLQLDGTVIWSRTYRANNKPQGIGITNDYFGTYIGWNETEAGVQKAVAEYISYDGTSHLGWKAGNAAAEYTLQSMRMYTSQLVFTALEKNAAGYSFIRMNYPGVSGPDIKETFSYALPVTASLNTSQDEGCKMLASANDGSNTIILTKTFLDNVNSPVSSTQLNFPYPVKLQTLTSTFEAGSMVGAVSQDGNYDIVFTKIDSAGMLPVCGSSQIPTTFSRYPIDYVPGIINLRPEQMVLSGFVPAVSDYSITPVIDCRELYCPEVPEPDSCVRTFYKEYRGNTDIQMEEILKTGNDLLLVGVSLPLPYNHAYRPVMVKVDTLGRQLDSKIFDGQSSLTFSRTIRTMDGNFISCGDLNNLGEHDLFIMKYTPDLAVIWQKKLDLPNGTGFSDIIESQEGDLYGTMGQTVNSGTDDKYLLKLTANGDPVWLRRYSVGPYFEPGSITFERIRDLNNFIYVRYMDRSFDYSPHLAKINKTDGSVVWVKKYQRPGGTSNAAIQEMIANDNHLYLYGWDEGAIVFMKIAEDGQLVSCKRSNTGVFPSSMRKLDNNKFIFTGVSSYYSVNPAYGVLEMDTDFKVLRRQFMRSPKRVGRADLTAFSDSVTYALATHFYSDGQLFNYSVQKFNFNSWFGTCEVTDFPFVLQDYPLNTIDKTIVSTLITLPQVVPANDQFIPGWTAYSGYYCNKDPLCSAIDLIGNSIICDNNEYTYEVVRNPGCQGAAIWNIDTIPGRVQIVGMTDTTIRIKALEAGTIRIRAKIFGTCDWLYDTLEVALFPSAVNTLNLGPDTVICAGNTIRLNAGPGYTSYVWQDGSANSTFDVVSPGIYYVDVMLCNTTFRDSVVVSPVAFDAGPDRTKCGNDTLHLQAPPGFLNYAWSPSYNINSTTTAQVIVNPSVDTAYFTRAEKTPGCFVYDTIRIKVNGTPLVYLGKDTSICAYGTLELKPFSSYNSYTWSTGATTSFISISRPGVYWLQATDRNQCAGRDTIDVALKECMTGFYIPNAFTPNNDGKNDIFRPLLFGRIVQFRFTIYNRWGEKVFDTTVPGAGWDGRFKGSKQDSHVFVWNCSYQLEGEERQLRKGSFILVR